MYTRLLKRFFDLLFSVILLFLTSPIIVIAALLVFLGDGESPIYTQRRIGKNGKEFYIYKLRSMRKSSPELPTGSLVNPKEYITPIGKILRKTSIDELPQLYNIIRGEMSLVGPRPALWNEYDLISAREEKGINAITPGLTGWAQVNGRAKISVEKKVLFDSTYADAIKRGGFEALKMDIKCILKTFIVVLKFKDVT